MTALEHVKYGAWFQPASGTFAPPLKRFSDDVVKKEFTFVMASTNLNNHDPKQASEIMPESPDRVGSDWASFQVDGVEMNPHENLSEDDKERIRIEVNWLLDLVLSGQIRYEGPSEVHSQED